MRLSSLDMILIEEVYLDISNDYFRKLEIISLCEKYMLSVNKLTKGFEKLYGISIYDYYFERCMEFANEELRNGATLKDLSFVFEYRSVRQFSHDLKVYLLRLNS